jgi:hypothetical protein
MRTLNLENIQLESLSNFEAIEVNGGDAYDEGYAWGREVGTGVRRGLAIVGILSLFFL